MELENLVKLIQTVSDSDLTGFQYEENGVKLKIQKEKEQMVDSTGAAQMAISTKRARSAEQCSISTEAGGWTGKRKRSRRAADQIPSGWNLLRSTVGRGSTICGSWRSCGKRTDGCHRRGDETDE